LNTRAALNSFQEAHFDLSPAFLAAKTPSQSQS
jgi:hypothetical protein